MSKNRVWIAAVGCFVLCFANLIYAESAPSSTNTGAMVDVLKTLESKGVISHQEFETLKQKVTTEAEQTAAPQLRTVAMQAEEGKAMNVVSAMDSGVGFHAGRFDIAFSGEVNGFYVHSRPDHNLANFAAANGFAAGCDLCLIDQSPTHSESIRSGLLPSDLSVKISTQEHGWDVAVFFGIWPAIQSSNISSIETGALPGTLAGGTPGIDFRQNFATLGRPGFGTLKIGRDLGLLGQEAILNDMTLLGAGSTNGNNQFPNNVTFGRIGVGYIYTDFLPQITYTTPSIGGLQAAASVIQPLDDPFDGFANGFNGHTGPMFQAKLTFTAPTHGPVKAKFWGNMMTQQETTPTGAFQFGANDGPRAWGVDYGAKLDFHGLSLVGYGYNGWGLGTTALLFDGIGFNADGSIDTRPSQGWYGQLTYTAGKNTFGFSYGQSNLTQLSGDGFVNVAGVPLIRNNTAYMAQYRLAVTKWDNLVAEYTHATAENQFQVKGTSDSLAFGTIVFF
ncbi:MAG TPA: porin [Terriglobales bacterium]|nr:porin [Terriglobales bacterium]